MTATTLGILLIALGTVTSLTAATRHPKLFAYCTAGSAAVYAGAWILIHHT